MSRFKFSDFFNPQKAKKLRMRSTLSESKVVENLLSFKYRRFLVERRLWFCYSQLLFSLYGLIFGMLLAQFEMREIEDHIIVDRVCDENGECEYGPRLANYTLEDITTIYQENYRSVIAGVVENLSKILKFLKFVIKFFISQSLFE